MTRTIVDLDESGFRTLLRTTLKRLYESEKTDFVSLIKAAGLARDEIKGGDFRDICFDEEEETLAGVKNGSIVATVVQQPYQFGYQAITLMNKYLKQITGLDLRVGEDRVQLMQSMGDVAGFSAALRVLAIDLSKIASDLRLLLARAGD